MIIIKSGEGKWLLKGFSESGIFEGILYTEGRLEERAKELAKQFYGL